MLCLYKVYKVTSNSVMAVRYGHFMHIIQKYDEKYVNNLH